MGAWGVGLYSNDFALDLRGAVGGVVRLPFGPDRLLALVRETQPSAADNPAGMLDGSVTSNVREVFTYFTERKGKRELPLR